MRTKRLILASSSPRRRALIGRAGLPFELARPDVDETPHLGEAPDRYVARLSAEKAAAIAHAASDDPAIILSADTTVVLDGEIVGKPGDPVEAESMLRRLRDRPHLVYTGLSVRDTESNQITTRVITTEVHMRAYTDEEISAYIATGDPFDKAGGYAVQHVAFRPVSRLNGCHTNVIGLPLCAAVAMLRTVGLPAEAPPCAPDHLPCQVTGV